MEAIKAIGAACMDSEDFREAAVPSWEKRKPNSAGSRSKDHRWSWDHMHKPVEPPACLSAPNTRRRAALARDSRF